MRQQDQAAELVESSGLVGERLDEEVPPGVLAARSGEEAADRAGGAPAVSASVWRAAASPAAADREPTWIAWAASKAASASLT